LLLNSVNARDFFQYSHRLCGKVKYLEKVLAITAVVWRLMLSLYNHKPLHQQPDTVNPIMSQKSPTINSEWEKATVNCAVIKFGCWCNIHKRKSLLVEHQQRRRGEQNEEIKQEML
jgi:hypothetical protein